MIKHNYILTPYYKFSDCVRVLDSFNLERVAEIIESVISGDADAALMSSPSVQSWLEFPDALMDYSNFITRELFRRGQHDITVFKYNPENNYKLPPFMGIPLYHKSHKGFLLRTYPAYYIRFWDHEDIVGYMTWPKDSLRKARERRERIAESTG